MMKVLTLLLVCSIVSGGKTVEVNVIYVGSSVETSGEDVSLADGVWPAVVLAVEQVNKIMESYNITVKAEEMHVNGTKFHSSCDRKEALDRFYCQVSDRSLDVGVVMSGCLESTRAVAENAGFYKLPTVLYSPLVSGSFLQMFPYSASMVPEADFISVGMAAILKHYDWKRAVIITQNLPEFTALTTKLHNELETANLQNINIPQLQDNVEDVDYFPTEKNIFILNMNPSRARWIICQAVQILPWKRRSYVWLLQGWYEELWWTKYGSQGTFGIEGGGDCTDGDVLTFLQEQRVLTVSQYPVLSISQSDTSCDSNVMEVLEDYRSHLGKLRASFSNAGAVAYDAVWALALGLNRSLSGAENSSCVTQVATMEPGLDRLEHLWRCIGRLEKDVRNTAFCGITGKVQIKDGLRQLEYITVHQYRNGGGNSSALVGKVSPSTDGFVFELVGSPLWNETPSDGKVVAKQRYFYTWLLVSSYVVNSIVLVAAAICLAFTIVFRNRKIVKMTSPNLNCVIVVGIFCLVGSTFIFIHPPADSEGVLASFCILRMWLIAIGFSLCFGTINVKMWRIFYIFRNPAIKKMVFKDWHLFLAVLAMVLLDLIILVPATIAPSTRMWPRLIPDVEHPGNYTNDRGEVVQYVVSSCTAPNIIIVLAMLFGFKAIIQLVGITLAFLIRNVQITVLNDSKEMRLSLYLTSIILLTIIVITTIFQEHLNIYAAGYCFGNPLSTFSVLIVVFFSKMFKLYKDPGGSSIFTSSAAGVKSITSLSLDASDSPEVIKLKTRVKRLMEEVSEAEKRLKDLNEQSV